MSCCPLPLQAELVKGPKGWVYSSHFRCLPELAPKEFRAAASEQTGIRGRLSLVGQMSCVWAVLRDRLRELIGLRRVTAELNVMRKLVGRDTHPIGWGDAWLSDLESLRGELEAWRAPASAGRNHEPTGNEKKVWQSLNGVILRAIAIAELVNTSETEVRNCVKGIRHKQGTEAILTLKGGGYYRPDAPPEKLVPPPRRRGARVRKS